MIFSQTSSIGLHFGQFSFYFLHQGTANNFWLHYSNPKIKFGQFSCHFLHQGTAKEFFHKPPALDYILVNFPSISYIKEQRIIFVYTIPTLK